MPTKKKASKRKSKWKWLRFRKNDHAHNLIVAAQRYIHGNKGSAVMLGGIGVMDRGPYCYSLVVDVTGKKPEKSA